MYCLNKECYKENSSVELESTDYMNEAVNLLIQWVDGRKPTKEEKEGWGQLIAQIWRLKPTPNVVIEVRGGVVAEVTSDLPIKYEIVDWDDRTD